MKSSHTIITSISAALILTFASSVLAQPVEGTGLRPSSGYSTGPENGERGMAPGNGRSRGFSFNSDNTRGWSLMTPEERTAHRDKMISAKNYDECKTIQENQHKAHDRARKGARKDTACGTPEWL